MRLAVLLALLAGCDALFHLDPVPLHDAAEAHDGPGSDAPAACSAGQATFTGAGIVAIAAGDVDHDGAMDLAVAEQTGAMGDVVILGGDAARHLPTRTEFAPGAQPISLAWYTASGATLPDLAVVLSPLNELHLYRNDNGTVGSVATVVTVANPTTALIVADVYADTKPEIVVGTTSSMLLYDVSTTALQPIGTNPLGNTTHFASGQLGGDSAQDLAASSSANNYSRIIGTRSASFMTVSPSTSAPTGGVAVGDFNNDHADDIAYSIPSAGMVNVALGPSFATSPAIPAIGATPLLAVELTGDTNLDLVAGTKDGVVLLAGNGDGTFANPVKMATTAELVIALAAGDFDHDGHTDLAYATTKIVTVMYECQ